MEQRFSQWYCVRLTGPDIVAGKKRAIAKQATAMHTEMGSPEGVALFATPFRDADYVTIYFTPAAAHHLKDMVDEHRGEPCDPPEDTDDLAMIAGDMAKRHELLTGAVTT